MDLISGTYVNLALQQYPDWLIFPMQLISLGGNVYLYFLIITAVYWCYDTRLGIRLALITSLSGWMNSIMKQLMLMPRPWWIDTHVKMLNMNPELSFGFPSGHAQMTLPFYGLIGYWFRSWKIRTGIIVLLLLIGISRLYLGLHFPIDVLGGWIAGIALLTGVILLDKPISTYVSNLSNGIIICSGFILSSILILMASLVSIEHNNFLLPAVWSGIDPLLIPNSILLSQTNNLLSGGFLFGIISGWGFGRNVPFSTHGKPMIRGERYLVGIIGFLLIWSLFGSLPNICSGQATVLLIWLQGVFLGLWIFLGAPWIFVKIGLTGNDSQLGEM